MSFLNKSSAYANTIVHRAFGDCRDYALQALCMWWFLFFVGLVKSFFSKPKSHLPTDFSNGALPGSLIELNLKTYLWPDFKLNKRAKSQAVKSFKVKKLTFKTLSSELVAPIRVTRPGRNNSGKKSSKVCLILCTYPVQNAIHGGQLRVRAIERAYTAEGWRVRFAGVLGNLEYESQDGFVPFPHIAESHTQVPEHPFMDDARIAFLASRPPLREALLAKIDCNPEIIQVEQPWLFDFAKIFRERHARRARIIYSSHNCEWQLKEKILRPSTSREILEPCVELVRSMEQTAYCGADGIVSVTASDTAWLSAMKPGKPLFIANNGVDPLLSAADSPRPEELRNIGSYCLYCASAHPPNMEGFFEMLSGPFGCLDSDQSLVVAGGAGNSIAADPRVEQCANLVNRLLVTGVVSEHILSHLLHHAHAIIIPITAGSGTNLKTAEALASGKYIIATPVAMRGFEKFSTSQGVFVCNDSESFKKAIRQAMHLPPLKLSEDELIRRKEVTWEYTLSGLPAFAESLPLADAS